MATATQGYSGNANFFDGSSHSILLFVSPQGHDINGNGSREYPWRSPQKAIDYVDDNLVSGGAMIVALDGTYYLPDGLTFGDTDYSARGGLVFRSENPGGAVLSGGVYLNGNGKALENNSADNRIHADYRSHVRKWDAGAAVPFGHNVTMTGWNFNKHQERAELFYDGDPMRLARFPNPGPHDPVNNRYTGNLTILQRLAPTSAAVDLRGMKTPDNTPGLLLRGNVSRVKYSDSQELITVLTGTGTQNGVVGYDPMNTGGGRQFEYPPYDENDPDQPEFYLCNSVYEIDEPGEYFLDDTNSTLYFYPPHGDGQLMLSKSEEPVITMNQTKGLSLGFFVIEGSRDSAVLMQEAEDVQVVGNLVRNVGRYGVYMRNGWRNTVRSNRITATGENAMVITGGDRTDLKPSGHLITNNELYRWARV
ncbi:MAG: right-handed parallel beta-helix repeat-containing protein, partial [Fimbriimonadaceae bacterium]